MPKWIGLFLLLVSICLNGAAIGADLQIKALKPGASLTVDRIVGDDKAMVRVSDAEGKPLLDLGKMDFTVTQWGRTAKIISVEPIAESLDVPRHIVLILDNSDSMRQRRAIAQLLEGVDELLKIVRPIDEVHVIVFEKEKTMRIGGRDLYVRTFTSSNPVELKSFVADTYSRGITPTTVLYEAMLAGIETIRSLPAGTPRFLVVFSDGEDINSSFKNDVVSQAAKGLDGFDAYSIDFMPNKDTDKFLSEFSAQNRGRIWKATSETNLVPIFQSVASRMQYSYVVSYLFQTTGDLAVYPDSVTIDEMSAAGKLTRKLDTSRLVLRPSLDSAYGIKSWNLTVSNAAGMVARQSGEGTPATELNLPLPADDTADLVAGGDLRIAMEVQDGKGQKLALDTPPVKVRVFKTEGDLSVYPASVTIDELSTTGRLTRKLDTPSLVLRPTVDSSYGIKNWNLTVSNAAGTVSKLSGEGLPAKELNLPLPTDDPTGLVAGGDLKVAMEVVDGKGQTLALGTPPVKVNVFKTAGDLSVYPASVTIDELSAAGKLTSKLDTTRLILRPNVDSSYGIERWNLTVTNADGTVATLSGEGAPAKELALPLPADDPAGLAAGGDLKVAMQVMDKKGQTLALGTPPVRVNVFQTAGDLAVYPASVTIEEIKTIDTSPMLAHVYFNEGSSEISSRYVRLAGPDRTDGFDEQNFRDMLEKYYQVLNIIGKRLVDNPEATITLVGCNSNSGAEKGNMKLSARRAEAVKSYLQAVWEIAPERIRAEARNLPDKPSTSRIEEGRADNRRVEVYSSNPAILEPILSVYLTNRIDTRQLSLKPEVISPHGIASWKLNISNSAGTVAELTGEGAPAKELNVPLPAGKLDALATSGDMVPRMELKDVKGQTMVVSPASVKVNFIQTSQRMAEKEEMRVQEKYALILFDFDRDVIDARNQKVLGSIADRIRKLPQATVEIVGHTDNIGTVAYNIGLSERRALAAYTMLTAAGSEISSERISHRGVGPNEPLYDNASSEARAFNRTVTITLEYLSKESADNSGKTGQAGS